MRIAVVMGGITSEREVSLNGGEAVLNSLLKQGYDAFKIDLNKENMISAFVENEYDIAYLVLHGEYGEDGRIQSILDILGKKYTGSGLTGSAVAIDKVLTKIIAKDLGIRIPKTYGNKIEIENYPVIVKPSKEGSSVGLYICENETDVDNALNELKNKMPLIEEFIQGEELTAGVFDGEKLGVVKIKPKSGRYDYSSKYTAGMTEYEYPAKIDSSIYEEVCESARLIHEKLGLKGITRSDFILKDNKAYFLEVNTCPGMTQTSLAPKLASLKGYTFDNLIKEMIERIK